MIRGFRFARIVPPVLCLCIACAATARQTRPDDEFGRLAMESNEDVHRYEIETNIAFSLPAPISRRDIERYAQILVLSEAQRQHLDQLHAEYLEAIKALERGEMQELVPLAKPIGNGEVEVFSAEYVEAANRMYEAAGKIASRVVENDRNLFSRLELSIGDSQISAMRRVRMHRTRGIAPEFLSAWPIVRIDLSRMIEIGGFEQEVLKTIDDLRWDYEQRLTPLLDAYMKIGEDHDRRSIELFSLSRYDDSGHPITPDSQVLHTKATQAMDDWKQHQARVGAGARPIADLNREYFPRFREALPEPLRRDFALRYQVRAYPWLFYPDRGDPVRLYEKIVARPELPQDLRMSMEAAWNTYRASYNDLCRKMEKEYDDWKQFLADNGGYSQEFGGYADKFRNLFEQRVQRNRDILKQLKSMLPSEVSAAMERETKQVEIFIDMEHAKLDQPVHRFPGN